MKRSTGWVVAAAAVVLPVALLVACGWIPTPISGDPVQLSPLPSTQISRCAPRQSHGDLLPDPACSPGAVNPAVAADGPRYLNTICKRGWPTSERKRTARQRSESVKRGIIADYGAYAGVGLGLYRLDDVVPVELGGSGDPHNLWPEMTEESYAKDLVENRANDAVCAGRMSLAHAQEGFAKDWTVLAGEVAPASGG